MTEVKNTAADILLVTKTKNAINRFQATDSRIPVATLIALSDSLSEWLLSEGSLLLIHRGLRVTQNGVTNAKKNMGTIIRLLNLI